MNFFDSTYNESGILENILNRICYTAVPGTFDWCSVGFTDLCLCRYFCEGSELCEVEESFAGMCSGIIYARRIFLLEKQ